MILGELPPVGARVDSRLAPPAKPLVIPQFHLMYLNSGTAALAQALVYCQKLRRIPKSPQVILPAYACPDLVAAAVYAGLKPVLVDIQPRDPGYDLDALARALNEQTVAVVAVNFLGIKENLAALSRLTRSFGALLVEDNAQWFPEDYLCGQASIADFIVTSFGRGKPVNLMGGGLLMIAEKWHTILKNDLHLPGPSAQADQKLSASYRLKAVIFNLLLKPTPYYVLSRMPFLHIGATEYHALAAIEPMDGDRIRALPANLQHYLDRDRWREEFYSQHLQSTAIFNLSTELIPRSGRLLRYPVLIDGQNGISRILNAKLGISRFYQRILVEVIGVADVLNEQQALPQQDFPGAREFASTLLTLPLHDGVQRRHLRQIETLLLATKKA